MSPWIPQTSLLHARVPMGLPTGGDPWATTPPTTGFAGRLREKGPWQPPSLPLTLPLGFSPC
jgi:hypothetical protein